MAYGAALEKRCAAMHRGFKSHPLRQSRKEPPYSPADAQIKQHAVVDAELDPTSGKAIDGGVVTSRATKTRAKVAVAVAVGIKELLR